jgi:hypothetical protein
MSHIDDLKVRIDGLNEAERVEYNRRLQLLKSTKEAANTSVQAWELANEELKKIKQLNIGAWATLSFMVAVIFFFLISDANPSSYLIVFACLDGLALVLINQRRGYKDSEIQQLKTQLTMLERDWAATGLEAGFMFAIIEMEKTLGANTSGYQSLQNVSSSNAAKKRTLSDYEYTLRNEIILNIQNEKDWWSKISVISGKWYEVNG